MLDYGYIKVSDNEAVISRLTWQVWKLALRRYDRAEWAIHEKPEDPVKFAEQVFLSAMEKGDRLDSVTIVTCDENYVENMVKNGKVINPETAKMWAKCVYDSDPDYADELFRYNGSNIATRPAILIINVELSEPVTGKFQALIDSKTYTSLYEWGKRNFGAECFVPPFLMSADTLLAEYRDIIMEECDIYKGDENFKAKPRILNVKNGKTVITIPIFVPEEFESATFEYKTLFCDNEYVTNALRDPWAVPLKSETEDIRTTGITECIADLFGCAVKVKPLNRFEKIDNLALKAGLPYDGFYDLVKGETERIYAFNSRGKVPYIEL